VKIDVSLFFEGLSREFKFRLNLTRISGTLHEGRCGFIIIFRPLLLRMTDIAEKSCREESKHTFCVQQLLPKILPFMR